MSVPYVDGLPVAVRQLARADGRPAGKNGLLEPEEQAREG